MEPYRYESETGATLRVDPAGHVAMVKVTGKNGGEAWAPVDAIGIPAITRAMYQACGQAPPVILPRPDISLPAAGGPLRCGDLSLRMYEVGISMGLPGITAAAISPDALRRRAAFMAAYADAVEAETDPADVEGLAAVLREAFRNQATPEESARAALRWMRDREADRG